MFLAQTDIVFLVQVKEKRKRKQKVIYTPSNKSARSKRGYNWKQTEINNV
jgi:hypothetical protein